MSKNLWFISDQHFSHNNILKFTYGKEQRLVRPEFSSVEEMDEMIIKKHNDVIGPYDKVYFLGDITFNKTVFEKIMPRLNGKKRLILGNHDTFKPEVYGAYFEKVLSWQPFHELDHKFVCSHFPVHEYSIGRHDENYTFYNVHGHLHQNLIPDDRYINICVEHTEYAPVHIEELIRLFHKPWNKRSKREDKLVK